MLYDKQVHITALDDPHTFSSPALPGGYRDVVNLLEQRVGVGHWRISLDSRKFSLSHRARLILGLSEDKGVVDEAAFIARFVDEDRALLVKEFGSAQKSNRGFEAVLRISVGDTVRVVELYCDFDMDEAENVEIGIGTIRDITERAKLHALSQGRAGVMRVLMNNIPSAIAVLDTRMNYLAASEHWAAGHGFSTSKEMLGKNHYELFPAAKALADEHKTVLQGTTLKRKRAFLKDHEGKPIEQMCVMSPWKTSHGKVGGMIIMLGTVDITNTLRFAETDDADASAPTMLEMLESIS